MVKDHTAFYISLEGDLGAGKTAFSQAFIQSVFPNARVRSPTFSLIESYENDTISVHHLDLYRLQDPEELEYMGVRDLMWHGVCLVEWASRGENWLPLADIAINMSMLGPDKRLIELIAQTEKGKQRLEAMPNP